MIKKVDEFTDELQDQLGHIHNFKFDLWLIKIGLIVSMVLFAIMIILKTLLALNIIHESTKLL